MKTKKIAVIIGSLRNESFNRKVAMHLMTIASLDTKLEILEIGQLPMYNQDLDDNPPSEWLKFRQRLKSFDGVLFLTPEYNRSVPAVLKNAIDVGSRPYGKNVWDGKPGAVVSVSTGAVGGFGANHHLRQSLVFLNVPTMQHPEAYIGGAEKLFNDKGILTNVSTKDFLSKLMQAFENWVSIDHVGNNEGRREREPEHEHRDQVHALFGLDPEID